MTHRTNHLGFHARAAGGLLILAVLGLTALALGPWGPVSAQQPSGPMLEISAEIEIEDSPRQYDLVQLLVEFRPGASNQSHQVNGRALFTVLRGELTRIEENGEMTVFKTGETFREAEGDHFDVEKNNGPIPAHLLATFLLEPGAPPLVIEPDSTPPSIGPEVLAMARTTVGTIPAQFTLTHGIFRTEPGGVVPPHTHDGWQMVTLLEGQNVVLLDGEVQTGATFVDKPGVVHEGSNPGPGRVRVMFARLNPLGAPPARPVTSATAQMPAIQPPSTGDGGLAGR